MCGEGHSEDGNQIVFCDQCDLAVHQGCYGVDLIPDKEWCVRALGHACTYMCACMCTYAGTRRLTIYANPPSLTTLQVLPAVRARDRLPERDVLAVRAWGRGL